MSGKFEITDSDLHAFVDGALDGEKLRAMQAGLESDPALAKRAAAFRADKAMLKQIYGPLADRSLPAHWLALAEGAKPPKTLSWRLVGSIAAVLVVALTATFAYRTLLPAREGEIVQTALEARRNSGGTVLAVAGDAGAQRYAGAISAAVSLKVKVPDLGKMGYRLTDIRLYAAGKAAELRYRDREERLFTLYVRRSDGTARFDQFEQAGLRVCIWQDDQLGMVMAGNVSTAAMQRLASLAYTGLTL